MAAIPTWYYRTDSGVVGPISSAELKRLLEEGVVRSATLIRRGQDGSWFPSEGIIAELGPARVAGAPAAGPEAAEWYFSLQGKRKMGPVTRSVLADMLSRGKLTATDVVWKPDMAVGVPASEIPGLLQTAVPAPPAGPQKPTMPPPHAGAAKPAVTPPPPGIQIPSLPLPELLLLEPRPRSFVNRLIERPMLLSGLAAGIVVLGLVSTACWVWLGTAPDHDANGTKNESLARSAIPARDSSVRPNAPASPTARSKAKTEKRNDSLVRSTPRKGQNQDNGKSQALPAKKTKQSPDTSTALLQPAKTAKGTNKARTKDQPKNEPQPVSSGSAAVTLETVLATPGKFTGKTITTDGLYKIGTHAKNVRGPDGKPVGWALPVARTDGSTICSGEAKVLGHEVYLLLEDGLAPFLDGVFRKLRFQITLKPLQRCLLTVRVRSQNVAGKDTPVVAITGFEILGACNIWKLIDGQFNTAFAILRVTQGNATVVHGEGSLWVELLGGEEKFVIPIRHKVREMRRLAATQRDTAMIDRYLQGEMSRVVMMSNAGQQQQTRMFEQLLGRRITP